MINQLEPLKSKIDCFGIYRDQKQPRKPQIEPQIPIHDK